MLSQRFLSGFPEWAHSQTKPARVLTAQFLDKGTPHPVAFLIINDFGSVLFDAPLPVFQCFTGADIDTFCTVIRTSAHCDRLAAGKGFINQNG
jgi:hypothetical protein